jgi:two-component system, LuxR family, response regulator FixJ
MSANPIVYVIEPDATYRRWLTRVIEETGLPAEAFVDAQVFWRRADLQRPGCLLLDLGADDKSGLAVLEQLARSGSPLAAVVLARQPDLADAVAAVRAGAYNFLDKNTPNAAMQHAVRDAVQRGAMRHKLLVRTTRIRHRIHQLSAGERAVLDQLLRGAGNSAAAESLGLSVRAIEARRSRLMKKMHARSLAELVRMAVLAEVDAGIDLPRER